MTTPGTIEDQLGRIRDHFSDHLYHQLLRRIYTRLDITRSDWQHITHLIDGNLSYIVDGSRVSFEDLYDTVLAFAAFVRACRMQICGRLRDLAGPPSQLNANERMLRDITIGTFDPNLTHLGVLLTDLVTAAEELDRAQYGDEAVVNRYRDLADAVDTFSRGC